MRLLIIARYPNRGGMALSYPPFRRCDCVLRGLNFPIGERLESGTQLMRQRCWLSELKTLREMGKFAFGNDPMYDLRNACIGKSQLIVEVSIGLPIV